MSTITFRTNPEVERAVDELAADTHQDRSAAIRWAILSAHRARQSARIRAEAEALAQDPEDRAEIRSIRADLEDISAW
jgi:predicted transcriptional regulator